VLAVPEPFRIDPPPDTREVGPDERVCKRCDQILPLDSFYAANKSSCKPCLQADARKRYKDKRLPMDSTD
jgi:hypothetical protein